jgi:DNA recombination protein RmuC
LNLPVLLLAIAVSAAVGALVAWVGLSTRLSAERAESARAQAQLAERLRGLEAAATQADDATRATRVEAAKAQEELVRAAGDVARLNTLLQKERESAGEKLQLLEQTRDEMTLRFKQLSQEILEDKSRRFTEQNQQNLQLLLQPLREKLLGFEQQVKQAYESDTRDRVALKEQITQLSALNQKVSAEANSLALALRGETKTQGNWGELILERILELSGLEKGREYETQFATRDEAGSRRHPDVIVHLPGGRDIVIDAKVSLTAHANLSAAADDAARATALAAHVSSVRKHIRELGDKDYHRLEGVGTLDFVLMFIPNEAAYIEAVRAEPALYEEALKYNIGLVCPSTLLPTLRTVDNLWQTERQSRNALAIAEEAGKLYDKFVGFDQDLSQIGAALAKAAKSYDDARNKLSSGRGNVVSKVELLKKMGAKASKQLPEGLLQQALPDGPADAE